MDSHCLAFNLNDCLLRTSRKPSKRIPAKVIRVPVKKIGVEMERSHLPIGNIEDQVAYKKRACNMDMK